MLVLRTLAQPMLQLSQQPQTGLRASVGPRLLNVGGLFGFHFLYFLSLKSAPAVEANLINYMWPLFIVLFSALLPGERLRWWHIAGALAGLAGTGLLVTKGGGFTIRTEYLAGYIAALGPLDKQLPELRERLKNSGYRVLVLRDPDRALPLQLTPLLSVFGATRPQHEPAAPHPSLLSMQDAVRVYLTTVEDVFIPRRFRPDVQAADSVERAHKRLLAYMAYDHEPDADSGPRTDT